MNGLEFTFEPPAYMAVLDTLQPGTALSAARFLTLMEQEPEETLEEALAQLDEKDILLDIRDLPKQSFSGELAMRLRREAQLVKEGKLPQGLEENDPLRLYLEEVAAIPVCGDVAVLAEKVLAGDENAVGQLTNLMLSRVIAQSFALAGQGVLLLDLIQEGSLGLWQAITSFCGGDMESHCDRGVKRTLARAITLQARENGVGQRMRQAMEDYRSVDERLLSELGRNATLEEIAEAMHMRVEETAVVADTMEAARMLSRAKPQEPVREQSPEDAQAVEDTAYFQMRQRIAELLEGLEETDVKLLTLRFGLEGGLPLSPGETGKKLGLSPEEVVAREAAVLAKLRKNP